MKTPPVFTELISVTMSVCLVTLIFGMIMALDLLNFSILKFFFPDLTVHNVRILGDTDFWHGYGLSFVEFFNIKIFQPSLISLIIATKIY